MSTYCNVPNQLIYLTEKCLNKMRFSKMIMTKIIQHLYPNRVYDHAQISSRMLKNCGKLICISLECILREI